jgi:hypothetical protein
MTPAQASHDSPLAGSRGAFAALTHLVTGYCSTLNHLLTCISTAIEEIKNEVGKRVYRWREKEWEKEIEGMKVEK